MMANKYNVEVQDENGDVYHFHSNSNIIFRPDGVTPIEKTFEEISTAMDKKVHYNGVIGANSDVLKDLDLALSDGIYTFDANAINQPARFTNGVLFVKNHLNMVFQTIISAEMDYNISKTAIATRGKSSGSGWQPWEPLAVAKAPITYLLPLVSGVTSEGAGRYSKDQFGNVIVNFKVKCDPPLPVGWNIISTLPAGYRPTSYISHFLCAQSSDVNLGNSVDCAGWVKSDGSITLAPSTSNGMYFAGSFTFSAEV